jgi:hypothetical protein
MQEKKKGEGDFNMDFTTFFYIFYLWTKEGGNWCVQKQEKEAYFFLFFDVVTKERKIHHWFSENKFQHEAQK